MLKSEGIRQEIDRLSFLLTITYDYRAKLVVVEITDFRTILPIRSVQTSKKSNDYLETDRCIGSAAAGCSAGTWRVLDEAYMCGLPGQSESYRECPARKTGSTSADCRFSASSGQQSMPAEFDTGP